MQEAAYWLSYLAYPILLFLIVMMWKKPGVWYWTVIFLLGALFVYARFTEPQQINVVEENYNFVNSSNEIIDDGLRVAVISDLHIGVYKKPEFLRRVVEEVNKLNPELVLIAGDVIYDPDPIEMEGDLLKELGNLKGKVLAVTGNHDSKNPGYIETEEVRRALRKFGVQVIDNEKFVYESGAKKMNIFGLSDLMENKYELKILNDLNLAEDNLILAHNPDASYFIDPAELSEKVFMVSGHTHGGQIRLPWIYKYVIPSEFGFDRGWYRVGNINVLVSSGLGETLLPMRLGITPEIILLKLKLK